MLRKIITFFIIILCCFDARAQTQRPWPLPVTPMGMPIVNVCLYEFSQVEFVPGIALFHKLSFDGRNYRSFMFMPAFESHLIKSYKRGCYLWTNENGASIELVPDAPNQLYELRGLASNAWQVISNVENAIYTYEKGKLTTLVKNNKKYKFQYEKNRLTSVSRTEPVFEMLAILQYDKNRLKKIIFRNKSMDFEEAREHGVISCRDADTEMQLFSSEYKNGLLRSWWSSDQDESYRWGKVRWLHYTAPFYPGVPAVIEDNRNIYQWSAGPRYLTGSCQSDTGDKRLFWRYHFLSRKLQILSNPTAN